VRPVLANRCTPAGPALDDHHAATSSNLTTRDVTTVSTPVTSKPPTRETNALDDLDDLDDFDDFDEGDCRLCLNMTGYQMKCIRRFGWAVCSGLARHFWLVVGGSTL
jgi:hypothetical protein|tara:strand:- start:5107 stop:5427 length:321 start_codon:yes stop_codon:yes gene_type:complete